ncbi:MAG: hypothetical protein D6729_10975 [Deltaproteobacteria bacterium]|nr:MAG: hypothetical protein D6729_10975 [Deltaproteobacteria bacterium]
MQVPRGRAYFSPSARLRLLVLWPEPRGVDRGLARRLMETVGERLMAERVGLEEVYESQIDLLRDAKGMRALGDRGDAALAALARRVGADAVVDGWVGRNGSSYAFALRTVGLDGRWLGAAGGSVRDDGGALVRLARARALGLVALVEQRTKGQGTSPAALLAARRGFFDRCLAEAQLLDPHPSGRAVVRMEVGADGGVALAKVVDSTFPLELEVCLRRAARRLRFPEGVGKRTLEWTAVLPAEAAATAPSERAPVAAP